MQLQRYSGAILCALGVLGSAGAVRAAAVAGSMSEPFLDSDYAAGSQFVSVTLPTSTQNGGRGFNATGTTDPNSGNSAWGGTLTSGSAGARLSTSPGLNYAATSYLVPSGNKLTLDATFGTGTQTQNVGRNLGQTIDSGTTYFSMLLNRGNETNRTMNFAFFNGGTERFAVGQIGAAAGGTSGNIGLLMNNSNPGGLVNGANPIAMGTNVTHLIVGRIDWNAGGNETVSIWVDPTDVTTEALAGAVYATTSGFELTAITGIRPFAGNNVTSPVLPPVTANFDEIRIGGTWESVTSLPVVPEPATVALAGAGFALLGGRRGRK